MSVIHQIETADQLLRAHDLGRCELVRGELFIMSPAGFEHGRIVSRIGGRLEMYVEQRSLGVVTGAETGFVIQRDPDTVRAPDVGFVVTERVPKQPTPGFFSGPPDLAVEVLSPRERPAAVDAKIKDWLDAGCRAVWVADPQKKTVSVHIIGQEPHVYDQSQAVTDDEIVPGFSLAVAEIFAL